MLANLSLEEYCKMDLTFRILDKWVSQELLIRNLEVLVGVSACIAQTFEYSL